MSATARTTFGALKVGAKFKVVNRVSGEVLPQLPAEKTEPGLYANKHKVNMKQPNWRQHKMGRPERMDFGWFEDTDLVEEVT